MERPIVRAVLFDLDNTLTHRNQSIEAFARYFYRRYSRLLKTVTQQHIEKLLKETDNGGYGRKENPKPSIKQSIAIRLHQELDWQHQPSEEELLNCWKSYFPKHSIAAPSTHTVIDLLRHRGLKIGIVSNGIESSRQATVAALGLSDKIDFLLSSETAGAKKPALTIFQQAAERLNLPLEHCMFIGDHPILDALGAYEAGMVAVWLSGFHAWPGERPKNIRVIHSLSEVITLVQDPHLREYGKPSSR